MILDGLAYIVLCLLVMAGMFSLWLRWREDPETFILTGVAFLVVTLSLWRLFE